MDASVPQRHTREKLMPPFLAAHRPRMLPADWFFLPPCPGVISHDSAARSLRPA